MRPFRRAPKPRLSRLILGIGAGAMLLTGTPAWAAEPALGLSELLARADAQNPDLAATRLRWESLRARSGYVGALEAPRVEAELMNLASLGGPSVRVTQMIPGGPKRALATETAEREAEMAEAEWAQQRLGVARDLTQAYFEYAYLNRSQAIYRQTLEQVRNLRKIADARYAVGAGTQQDPLRAQREVSRLLERGFSLDQELDATRARINTLADRPLDAAVQVPPELPAPAALPSEAAIRASAEASSPVLRVMRARIAMQGVELRMAQAERSVPDVEVGMAAGLSMPGDMPYLGGMVGLNLPWLSPGRFEGRIKQSESAVAAAQAAYQAELNRLRGEVRELRSALIRTERQLQLYRQGLLPQASQALQAALAAYQVNKADFDAVLESQTAIYQVQTDHARAMADYQQTLAKLEALVGAPLSALSIR